MRLLRFIAQWFRARPLGVRGENAAACYLRRKRYRIIGRRAAVDDAKQNQLRRLAQVYVNQHGLSECPVRFDVVAITWPAGTRRPQVEHYISAF